MKFTSILLILFQLLLHFQCGYKYNIQNNDIFLEINSLKNIAHLQENTQYLIDWKDFRENPITIEKTFPNYNGHCQNLIVIQNGPGNQIKGLEVVRDKSSSFINIYTKVMLDRKDTNLFTLSYHCDFDNVFSLEEFKKLMTRVQVSNLNSNYDILSHVHIYISKIDANILDDNLIIPENQYELAYFANYNMYTRKMASNKSNDSNKNVSNKDLKEDLKDRVYKISFYSVIPKNSVKFISFGIKNLNLSNKNLKAFRNTNGNITNNNYNNNLTSNNINNNQKLENSPTNTNKPIYDPHNISQKYNKPEYQNNYVVIVNKSKIPSVAGLILLFSAFVLFVIIYLVIQK